jgi:hypothetical protein
MYRVFVNGDSNIPAATQYDKPTILATNRSGIEFSRRAHPKCIRVDPRYIGLSNVLYGNEVRRLGQKKPNASPMYVPFTPSCTYPVIDIAMPKVTRDSPRAFKSGGYGRNMTLAPLVITLENWRSRHELTSKIVTAKM